MPLLSSESGGRPLGVIQFTNKVVVQNDAADSDDDDELGVEKNQKQNMTDPSVEKIVYIDGEPFVQID